MWAVSQKRTMIRKFMQLYEDVSLSNLAISSRSCQWIRRIFPNLPVSTTKKNVEGYRIGYSIASNISLSKDKNCRESVKLTVLGKGEKKERDVNCTLNSSFHAIQIPADFAFIFICNEDSKQKVLNEPLYFPASYQRGYTAKIPTTFGHSPKANYTRSRDIIFPRDAKASI